MYCRQFTLRYTIISHCVCFSNIICSVKRDCTCFFVGCENYNDIKLINTLPRHIAIDYYKLKSLSSKLQKGACSIGFKQHALFHELTPTFAKVKRQFINHKDKYSTVKSILSSHLLEHRKNLKKLSYSHLHIRATLRNKIGVLLYRCVIEVLLKSLLSIKMQE